MALARRPGQGLRKRACHQSCAGEACCATAQLSIHCTEGGRCIFLWVYALITVTARVILPQMAVTQVTNNWRPAALSDWHWALMNGVLAPFGVFVGYQPVYPTYHSKHVLPGAAAEGNGVDFIHSDAVGGIPANNASSSGDLDHGHHASIAPQQLGRRATEVVNEL